MSIKDPQALGRHGIHHIKGQVVINGYLLPNKVVNVCVSLSVHPGSLLWQWKLKHFVWSDQIMASFGIPVFLIPDTTFNVRSFKFSAWRATDMLFKIFPGPWFNIKMSSYQYRKSHCGDKTVIISYYIHYGISCNNKMASLFWINHSPEPLFFSPNNQFKKVLITKVLSYN